MKDSIYSNPTAIKLIALVLFGIVLYAAIALPFIGFSIYTLEEGRQTTLISLLDTHDHSDYYDWDTVDGTPVGNAYIACLLGAGIGVLLTLLGRWKWAGIVTLIATGLQSVFYVFAHQSAVNWCDNFIRLSFGDVFGSGAVYSWIALLCAGLFLLVVSVKTKAVSTNVVS